MGIGINVNGDFVVLPSVIPILDSSELISAEQGAQGILAIIGLGTGLIKPKTLVKVDVTTGAIERQIVAGSEILKAAKLAINPSADVPGVQELRLITVNPATQSTLMLVDNNASPNNVLDITSRGWGLKFNSITVTVDDTMKEVTLKLDLVTEIFKYGTGAGTIQALVDNINAKSGIASATFVAAGDEDLKTISATPLAGAVDGTPVAQDFTDVFNVLEQNEINLECLVDASQTNQVAFVAHIEKTRRIGFTGQALQTAWEVAATRVTNIGNLKTRAAAINSKQVLFNGIGTDGEASFISIAKYAGIAAGTDPSVPLNNKDLRTLTAEAELTESEAEDLLQAGVSPPFRRINTNRPGFMISDGLSTFIGDDNLFNRVISIRRGAFAMENDIVEMVQQFLGQEATEVTIGRVVSAVNNRLARALRRDQTVRIESFEEGFTKAVFESTVLKIFYRFAPIQPIRFIVPIGSLKPTLITRTIEIPLGQ